MRKIVAILMAATVCLAMCSLLAGCSSGSSADDLKSQREITWEDNILTVNLGTNKTTGCEWKVEFGDDSVIGWGIVRIFHLSDEAVKDNLTAGTSEITFEGKSAGSTYIKLTTPYDWEGQEPGYTYVVHVLVNDDGTIADAHGEEITE